MNDSQKKRHQVVLSTKWFFKKILNNRPAIPSLSALGSGSATGFTVSVTLRPIRTSQPEIWNSARNIELNTTDSHEN